MPGIIAGMILCFAKAMGEFGATITFVSNIPGETQTLPSAIYTFTQVPGGDAGALRLTLVSVAISMVALLASELMARRAAAHWIWHDAARRRHATGSASFVLDARFESRRGLTALFGRSGSGKTSLINVIAGLIRPDAGRIARRRHGAGRHRARRLRAARTAAGSATCSRRARLFPHLTVRQNLLYGRWFAPERRALGDLDAVVDLLGIGGAARPPAGRLPAARSSASPSAGRCSRSPRLLLMDEPLASLDEARKAEILPYIERLRDEARVPIVYVSHSDRRGGAAGRRRSCCCRRARSRACGPTAEIMHRLDLFPLTGRAEAGAILEATRRAPRRTLSA